MQVLQPGHTDDESDDRGPVLPPDKARLAPPRTDIDSEVVDAGEDQQRAHGDHGGLLLHAQELLARL